MSSSFRLMSVNLLHDHCDVPYFAGVLADLSPDVVITQELAPGAADALSGRYPHHRLHPAHDYKGRGIATVLRAEFRDLDMPGRQGTAAALSVGPFTVRLAGVHLRNPVDFPWWVAARDRRSQVGRLLEWVESSPGPVVMAGDFNASPAWPAYRRVSGRLTDLIAERDSSNGKRPGPTWGWRPGWPKMLRIDHVFGRGVGVIDHLLVPIKGSDHSAIVADVVVDGP